MAKKAKNKRAKGIPEAQLDSQSVAPVVKTARETQPLQERPDNLASEANQAPKGKKKHRRQKFKADFQQPDISLPAPAVGPTTVEERPSQSRPRHTPGDKDFPPRKGKFTRQAKAYHPNSASFKVWNQGNPGRQPFTFPSDQAEGTSKEYNNPSEAQRYNLTKGQPYRKNLHQGPQPQHQQNRPQRVKAQPGRQERPKPLPRSKDQPQASSSHLQDQETNHQSSIQKMPRRFAYKPAHLYKPGEYNPHHNQPKGMYLASSSLVVPNWRNVYANTTAVPDSYGITQSTNLLERSGFHKEVTLLRPAQYYVAWEKMALARCNKPARSRLYGVADGLQGALGLKTRDVTLATLVFDTNSTLGRRHLKTAAKNQIQSGFLALLHTGGIGPALGEQVFALGRKAVQSLSSTSLASWDATVSVSNIWNFLSRDFHFQGHSGVFLVVTPEYTVGDFLRARDLDPMGLSPTNPVRGWFDAAMSEELEIFTTIKKIHDLWKKQEGEHPLIASMDGDALEAVIQLTDTEDIWRHRQFVWTDHTAKFEPQHRMLGNCLKTMVRKLYQQRQGVKVLHFEKTPFLDRRMLAVILRGLPKVTMIGIYDCPLIHFGDVICILDLIHEINTSRGANGLPLIDSFDFRPSYVDGMPFDHPNAATYGLTWHPLRLQVVQRGFFNIILKAFFKSRALKLKLLFDRDGPFRDFLFQVPNLPFAVPCFLDALYRLVEIPEGRLGADTERKKAIFDLLKPIRIHLDKSRAEDWNDWNDYGGIINLETCASCGYHTFPDFFSYEVRNAGSEHRVCAGCGLQRALDTQHDHLRSVKVANLGVLFPAWEASDFNICAPVGSEAEGLLELKLTRRTSPEMTTMQRDRHNKVNCDSLQNLPSLEKLGDLSGESDLIWRKFLFECEKTDISTRATRLLCTKKKSKDRRFPLPIFEHPMDHVDEPQPSPPTTYERLSYTFRTAMELHVKHVELRWAPGMPKGLEPTSLPGFW